MRRHFVTADPAELSLHDHAAWCGEGPEDLRRVALRAFSVAAKRGEQMVFVSQDPDPAHLAELDGLDGLLRSGALRLATVEDTYGNVFDPAVQRVQFEQMLDGALTEGRTGVCVVADNSSLVAGSDDEFAAWLAWEATADNLQSDRPLTGICYFDRQVVAGDRLDDLAVIHPILSAGFDEPSLRLFVDEDVVRIVGEVDYWCAERLRRILSNWPSLPNLELDLSGLDFIHHQALLALAEVAGDSHSLRFRGTKPIVRRVWSLLDQPTPALEFS